MINPGSYMAKMVGYGVTMTSTGAPRATIKFLVGNEAVFWAGTLTGGGIDITLKSLIVCGLRSPDDLERIAEGPVSGVLDMAKTFEVVVEHETDQNGKTYAKVRFINDTQIGGDKAISRVEFAKEIVSRSLKGDVARLLAERGLSKTPEEVSPPHVPF